MKNLINKLTSKSFFLEFKTLNVPTVKEICNAIQDYAKESGSEVAFLSVEDPVTFCMDDVVYATKRGSGRGGPIVRCVEQK